MKEPQVILTVYYSENRDSIKEEISLCDKCRKEHLKALWSKDYEEDM
jgi:hypothetical protein